MPTRRLNFTGRRRIKQEDVTVTLQRDHEPPRFEIDLSFDAYGLPDEAAVAILARAGLTQMRFPYGCVARLGSDGVLDLSGFDGLDAIRFEVRVLDTTSAAARVLAESAPVRPTNAQDKNSGRSFVEVRHQKLQQRPWKLMPHERPPLLLINSDFDDGRAVVRSDSFRGLALAEVYRQLLEVAIQDWAEEEDGSWQRMCVVQAERHTRELPPDPADKQAVAEWIDAAVSAFCRKHSLLKTARKALEV